MSLISSPDSEPPLTVVVRSVSAFMVDMAARQSLYFGHDADRPILVMTTLSANLAHIPIDSLGARTAGPGGDWDGVDLRPVSILSLSRSMNLPFETVRRKAHALCDTGYLQRRDDGLVVAAEGMNRPAHVACAAYSFTRLQDALSELDALGVNLTKWRVPSRVERTPTPPLLIRLAYDFQVRQLELLPLAFFKSNLRAILWSTVLEFNLEAARQDRRTAILHATTQLPDAQRIPVTATAVAQRLRLPFETVRRNLLTLEALGAVRRMAKGRYIVPRQDPVPPAWREYNVNLLAAFSRMLSDLWRIGYDPIARSPEFVSPQEPGLQRPSR